MLTYLACYSNQLTVLDVSKNTALSELNCSNNKLTAVDVSKNTALTYLSVEWNQLTVLDISHCAALKKLVLENQPSVYRDKYYYWGKSIYDNTNNLMADVTVEIITTESGSEEPATISASKITLSKANATLTRTGKQKSPTLQLKVTVLPDNASDKSVTWASDNTKVATVDKNGKVTALKAGTAVITCTAKDGSGVKATCKITVKDAKATKITLNKTKATLKVKGTLQLKVKKFTPVSPLNTKVKWTTSNKKVATVSKTGKVTAKGKGTCVITCTAQDGSKKTATCKITVK